MAIILSLRSDNQRKFLRFGYDELVISPVFITDNRIIAITDTQIPLIDNVSITRSEEWLGIGEEYEIRLFASEPLEIQDQTQSL